MFNTFARPAEMCWEIQYKPAADTDTAGPA